MLRFRSMASGSTGNATLIEAFDGLHRSRLLLDCGLGLRQLKQRLQQAGLQASDLDAIFITHEHSDHIGCALKFAARHEIPLWMSAGTLQNLKIEPADGLRVQIARDEECITLGALQVTPFTVPHDAREPLQVRCTDGNKSLGILTDLGHVTRHVVQHLQACHALLLESNHDSDMLAQSRYPEFLKRRISSSLGHLNNRQSAQLLAQLKHPALNQVVAAHMSQSNNRPELVQAAFSQVLNCLPGDVLLATPDGLDWMEV